MVIGIAGPYSAKTETERLKNLDLLNRAAAKVLELGHVPVVGVNAALPVVKLASVENEYDAIMRISFSVLENCEALFIIAESPGANREREIFLEKGLPVYHTFEEIPKYNA